MKIMCSMVIKSEDDSSKQSIMSTIPQGRIIQSVEKACQ